MVAANGGNAEVDLAMVSRLRERHSLKTPFWNHFNAKFNRARETAAWARQDIAQNNFSLSAWRRQCGTSLISLLLKSWLSAVQLGLMSARR